MLLHYLKVAVRQLLTDGLNGYLLRASGALPYDLDSLHCGIQPQRRRRALEIAGDPASIRPEQADEMHVARILADGTSFKACATTTLGRKLDIVCSVQPYG